MKANTPKDRAIKTASGSISEQAKAHGLSFSVSLPETMDTDSAEVSFYDAVLQPRWSYEAVQDDAVQINPPWTAWRVLWSSCCRRPTILTHDSKMILICRSFRPSTAAVTIWPVPV